MSCLWHSEWRSSPLRHYLTPPTWPSWPGLSEVDNCVEECSVTHMHRRLWHHCTVGYSWVLGPLGNYQHGCMQHSGQNLNSENRIERKKPQRLYTKPLYQIKSRTPHNTAMDQKLFLFLVSDWLACSGHVIIPSINMLSSPVSQCQPSECLSPVDLWELNCQYGPGLGKERTAIHSTPLYSTVSLKDLIW